MDSLGWRRSRRPNLDPEISMTSGPVFILSLVKQTAFDLTGPGNYLAQGLHLNPHPSEKLKAYSRQTRLAQVKEHCGS